MIDHFSLSVKDFDQSLNFYDQTLAALGCERLISFDIPDGKFAGYGKDPKPSSYHLGYYDAFFIASNGWRIEACFHGYQPEGQ